MPEPDIAKVKRNVSKMVSMNAPEGDIDQYIASEGTTIDAVRAFKPQMFKTEAEGRLATDVAQKEQERLTQQTKPLQVVGKALNMPIQNPIAANIVGGFNTAVNTATVGVTELPYALAGTTNVPSETGDIAKGIGMGVGIVGGIPSAIGKGAGAMLEATGIMKAPGQYMAMGRELKSLQSQYGKTAEGVKVPMARLAEHIGEKVSFVKDKLSSFKKDIDNAIFSESEKAASFVHSKLPQFFGKASKEYGNRLDEIAQFADTSNPITRQQVNELIDNIQADAASHQLDIGSVFKKLTDLKSKYPMQDVEGLDRSMEIVPFKEVNSIFREAMKKTSGAFKGGTRVMPEDVVGMIAKEHYGNFLENKVAPEVADSLKRLNQEYRPIAEARKEAGRIFKPYSEFKEGQGSSWLAKVAENTAKKDLSIGEQKLLSLLQEGSSMGEGIGDVTAPIRALGKQKVNVSKEIESTIDDLIMKQNKVKDYEATKREIEKKTTWALGILGLTGFEGAKKVITGKF